MPLLEEIALRSAANTETFRRGKTYARNGAVLAVETERLADGNTCISGRVEGSRVYRASFVVDTSGRKIVNTSCTCPYDWGGVCKHIVAVGLTALKQMEKAERGRLLSRGDHGLEALVLRVSYDAKEDLLTLQPAGLYGSHERFSPSGRSEEEEIVIDADGESRLIRRDLHAERTCAKAVRSAGFFDAGTGRFFARGTEGIYRAVAEGLPELSKHYKIEPDESARGITNVQIAPLSSQWKLGGGTDWFSFSVDWHCAGLSIRPEQVERLARGLDRAVRLSDGSFVTVENAEALAAVSDLLSEGAKRRGVGKRMPLWRALDLAARLERLGSTKMASPPPAVDELLRDARAGRLLREPILAPALASKLRPYQRDAVAWGAFLRHYRFGGILADEMGLGKTLEALAILGTERPSGAGPSLVLCPTSLVDVWCGEVRKFLPNFQVVAVEGTATARVEARRVGKDADLLVTSYAAFLRDVEAYLKPEQPWYYTILDEAQFVKNAATKTARLVRHIPSQYRLALTGTPLENGVHELWSIFEFVMPGYLGSADVFRARYQKPISEHGDQRALAELRARTAPFILRRTKEVVAPELPPRLEEIAQCPLTAQQLAAYVRALEAVRSDVFGTVETRGFKRSRIQILTALLRLRQICDHPALVLKSASADPSHSGKMERALELVREAVSGGHKVLFFSQFTSMLDLVRNALEKEKIRTMTIEGKTKDRGGLVKKFTEDPLIPVFLLSLRAAGTGLTLTVADTVILYDPWWNPLVERQAMDRAHRIGQTKPVTVYKLVTKGTVEEKVLELQEKKKRVFDALLSESVSAFRGLTWEDVQQLFEPPPLSGREDQGESENRKKKENTEEKRKSERF